MFYQPAARDHGLPHDPFKALIAPRPIGWVATQSKNGTRNIAPFSFFNAVGDNPAMVMFSLATMRNIEETGECTVSLASKALTDEMNMSSAGVESSVSEFDLANIETAESTLVTPPRVANSPAALECKHWQTIPLPPRPGSDSGYFMVLATVVGVHINDQFIIDGRVDTPAMELLARMGYMDYAVINADSVFSLNRPAVSADKLSATLESGPWNGKY